MTFFKNKIKDEISYKAFMSHAPFPMLVIDKDDLNILDANNAAIDFYGFNYDELLYMSIDKINIYNEYTFLDYINQENNAFKLKQIFKDNSIKLVDLRFFEFQIQNKKYILLIIDNTKTLSLNNTAIEFLFEYSDDILIIINKNNELTYYNTKFKQLLSLNSFNKNNITFELKNNNNLIIKNFTNTKILFFDIDILNVKYDNTDLKLIKINKTKTYSKSEDNIEYIKQNNDFSNSNDFGFLIFIKLYLSTDSDKIFNKIKNCTIDNIKTLLNEFNFKILNTKNNIYLYIKEDFKIIKKIINKLTNSCSCSNVCTFNSYNPRLNIAISKKEKLSIKTIEKINLIALNFDETIYNNVIFEDSNTNYINTINLENYLKSAILNDEFELYFQKIVNLKTKKVDTIEILIRWFHSKYGSISPAEFIPLAEKNKLIIDIDLWVIQHTFDCILSNSNLFDNLKIHINISPHTLSMKKNIEFILNSSKNINKNNIFFEITEYSMNNIFIDNIKTLKKHGFRFALDDFGTGYACFTQIKLLDIDLIKIDRAFAKNIYENIDSIMIIKSIISMCKNLNIEYVCEGVETLDELEYLHSLGINHIQGYVFNKPSNINTLNNDFDAQIESIFSKLKQDKITKTNLYKKDNLFIQDFDEEFNIINPNISLATYLKYDLENFKKINVFDLIPIDLFDIFIDLKNKSNTHNMTETILVNIKDTDKNLKIAYFSIKKDLIHECFKLYLEFIDNDHEIENELYSLRKIHLQAFYEAPSGMILLNNSFLIRDWNKSCSKIFGISKSKALNSNIFKLIKTKNSKTIMHNLFKSAQKFDIAQNSMFNIDNKNNVIYCNWQIKSIFNSIDNTYFYICIINDVTKELEINKKLLKLDNAINNSESIIIITDLYGNIEYVNRKFCEISGYTSNDILGKKVNTLSSNEQNNQFYKNLWQTITTGKKWTGVFHNKKKNNDYYWCDATIYPIKEDNKIIGYIAIQTDITNEKKLTDINKNLKYKLFEQDKIASLGILTSGLVHEVNSPLTYIKTNFRYINKTINKLNNIQKNDLFELNDAMEDINDGIERIEELIKELKGYIHKIDKSELETFDLIKTIQNIIYISKNEYKYYSNIEFEYDKSIDHTIIGVKSKLKQILMNLIINSTYAIKEKYSKTDQMGLIQITIRKIKNFYIINFKDDGIGISETLLKDIFKPLFTTKPQGIGTGLGLSIIKEIIEKDFSGKIECSSTENIGTEFTIAIKINNKINTK